MLQRHLPVQVEVEMTDTIGDKPIEVYNSVVEIRVSEKPDEVVIIGGHLDSWDLGTGSTDDGTGSAAVLEAARALTRLNLKPKRTIRFVLFSGEEQGLYGSQEYVKAHKNDLEKISAVLVHDTGTGRVLTLGLHDNYQDRELVDQVLAPLRELKLLEPRMARSFGQDHLSFDEAGVPGFFCIQERAEYNLTHHSQSDTFDKVWKDDLNQGAQVLAAWANLAQASHWTAEQFKAAGLTNVHLEDWTIANSWTRGPATGRLILPTEQTLTLASAGWSPSTNGSVRGPVVGVTFEKLEDLEQYKGKLKGAIILFGRLRRMEAPEFPLATPWDKSTIPLMHPENEIPIDPAAYRQARLAALKMFAEEKVNAVLLASEKEFGLLNMSAQSREYQAALVPVAYAVRENYEQLWHVQAEGHAEAEGSIAGSVSGKPVQGYNTVAEIRGTEKPDEVVIIGADLDSWDLGTGATDNGTGSMAVLAAARALQKVGGKPKRTIRFVLFTGEEQGLNGSREYVRAHKDELGKISGVLVHDSGTGKVLTVGLMANYGARETMDRSEERRVGKECRSRWSPYH